ERNIPRSKRKGDCEIRRVPYASPCARSVGAIELRSETKATIRSDRRDMSIFNLHRDVIGDYREFVQSFFTVADDRARQFIEHELVEEERLWPEPLLQVSPSYARTASVDDLTTRGLLLAQTANVFRCDNGDPYVLYQHQLEAMERAREDRSYVVTSGTG